MNNKEEIVLTLDDDNEYVVIDNIYLEEQEYLYLIDINNNSNFMFCLLNENKLTKITDLNLIKRLLNARTNK